jgi:hypothetical protein
MLCLTLVSIIITTIILLEVIRQRGMTVSRQNQFYRIGSKPLKTDGI